jgi:DNA polymerase III epsilon subunit-like protein
MEPRIVFVDIETGGLDPKKNPIIQIGAAAVDEHLEVLEAFETKIQFDERKASADALRKNHYHPGVWANEGLPAKQAAREFAEFLRRHASVAMLSAKGESYQVAQLVAHNASFDGPFLFEWFEKQGVYLPAKRLVLCTMQLAMWNCLGLGDEGPRSFKLQDLCEYFGVPFHAAKAHDALGDVTATVELFRAMSKSAAQEELAA